MSELITDQLLELHIQNEFLKKQCKEIKIQLKDVWNSFKDDKARINTNLMSHLHAERKKSVPNTPQTDDEKIELQKQKHMLEQSLRNIADKYVLIDKVVWRDQFNGNVTNTNVLLEKIYTLEKHINILENEIIEKEHFFHEELALLK